MANNVAAGKWEYFSSVLQTELYETYVGAFIANTKFEGEFVGNDTVHFPRFTKLTVSDLATSYSNITAQDVTLTDETFTLDNRKAAAYQISDEDYIEMKVDPDSELITSLRDAFAKEYDTEIFKEYANASYDVDDGNMETATNGGTGNAIIVSKDNVFDLFTAVVETMDENNMPDGNRWIVVSPAERRLLVKSPNLVRSTVMGDRIVTGGVVGEVEGLTIYYSNNLQTVTNTKHVLAGQGRPICFAANIRPSITFVTSDTQALNFVNTVKAQTKFGVKTFHEGAIKLIDVQINDA